MIHWSELSFSYPDQAQQVLRNVSLRIQPGEFVLVAGPSGSGKSTLLRTINGLVPHFSGGRISGRISVNGHDPLKMGPHAMSPVVGFVQQDPESQFVVDTVEDELAFALENQGYARQVMIERVQQVLDELGITALRSRRISQLSAGQKQRVALGSVLTLRPKVLVLDEPTSQLDPLAADEVLATLRQLNREWGLTVVLSEHRLERVVPYVDRVIYVPGPGESLLAGPPRETLTGIPLAPPLVLLAQALGWTPIPLTVDEASSFTDGMHFRPALTIGGSKAAASMATIDVRNLAHDYDGIPALHGVDLKAYPGEMIALTGGNGSGKTTLLKHLVGLLKPKEGSVLVHGMDTRTSSVTELIAKVGYVPQDPSSLLFADTVREELEFTRRAHGQPPTDDTLWLDRLGLTGLGARFPRELSVGERQRVALASILVAEPETLLLDEPTRGMDALEKASLARLLKEQAAAGHTIIMATHDVELAAECATRVIALHAGRIVADGETGEVMLNNPRFSSQVIQVWRDPSVRTVADVLERRIHAR